MILNDELLVGAKDTRLYSVYIPNVLECSPELCIYEAKEVTLTQEKVYRTSKPLMVDSLSATVWLHQTDLAKEYDLSSGSVWYYAHEKIARLKLQSACAQRIVTIRQKMELYESVIKDLEAKLEIPEGGVV